MTEVKQLNHEWNADPNAPCPEIRVDGADLTLSFQMNYFQFTSFQEGDIGALWFLRCARYRLGPTNDEGWYRGQCRFSRIAPNWGEFYEVIGDRRLEECPSDWVQVGPEGNGLRHFLFSFRDNTLECEAIQLLAVPRYDLLAGRPYSRFPVQTTRGCPWRCDFCASNVMLNLPYRKRPVAEVIRDVQAIRRLQNRPLHRVCR